MAIDLQMSLSFLRLVRMNTNRIQTGNLKNVLNTMNLVADCMGTAPFISPIHPLLNLTGILLFFVIKNFNKYLTALSVHVQNCKLLFTFNFNLTH